jgi:uncharacterized protein (DUF58 family)
LTYKQTALFTACAFLALSALFMRAEWLHFMAAAVLAVPLVAFTASRLSLRGVRVSRLPPARVLEGESFSVGLVMQNSGRLPRLFLRASDEMPEWVKPRTPSDFLIPTLWPGDTISLSYEAEPEKRGAFVWPGLRLSSTDPFGIFEWHRRIFEQHELVVLPAPIVFEGEQAAPGGVLAGVESQRMSPAARGLEFYGIREYQPGDEMRRIHWRSSARLGRLAVVEDDQTVAADLTIVLDLKAGTEAGSGKDTTLEYAVKMAASLASFAINSGASATLVCAPREKGPTVVRAAAEEEFWNLLELLARVKANSDLSLVELMNQFQPPAGSAVFIITAAVEPALASRLPDWVSQNVKICAVLLDSSSFDHEQHAGRKRTDGLSELVSSLAAVGVTAFAASKGDDLPSLLRRATYAIS